MKTSVSLTAESTFSFSCHKDLPCFTQCCRDVNIFLTPYDILRMKNRLAIPSEEFLSRYTLLLVPERSEFPVVILKMSEHGEKWCPFVGPAGCSIYEDRPWSCRMYPVDRGEREGEFRLIADPSICLGMREKREWSVRQYLCDQGLDPYNEMEKPFANLASNPCFSQQKLQSPKIQEMCRMALYDLDRFRRFVLESRFLEVFYVEEEVVDRLREDDLELMKLAYRWLKFDLISGETLKMREGFIKAKPEKPRR